MSDIERVPVDLWRNPDVVNRAPAGAIPIGDFEIEDYMERKSGVEAFVPDAEPYTYWGDTEVAPAPVRKKAAKKAAARKKDSE